MRDRFIEMLQKRSCFYNKSKCNARCSICDYVTIDDNDIGKLADHFLANGAVVPLCKVGDIVYQVDTLFNETIITELTVIELTIDSKGIKTLYGMTNKGSVYCFDRGYNLNNIKFTREEAERALKEGVQE